MVSGGCKGKEKRDEEEEEEEEEKQRREKMSKFIIIFRYNNITENENDETRKTEEGMKKERM